MSADKKKGVINDNMATPEAPSSRIALSYDPKWQIFLQVLEDQHRIKKDVQIIRMAILRLEKKFKVEKQNNEKDEVCPSKKEQVRKPSAPISGLRSMLANLKSKLWPSH